MKLEEENGPSRGEKFVTEFAEWKKERDRSGDVASYVSKRDSTTLNKQALAEELGMSSAQPFRTNPKLKKAFNEYVQNLREEGLLATPKVTDSIPDRKVGKNLAQAKRDSQNATELVAALARIEELEKELESLKRDEDLLLNNGRVSW